MDVKKFLASRAKIMDNPGIGEILRVIGKPGMISLAGGLPAPETFPLDIIDSLNRIVMKKYGPVIFQYGQTEGFGPLRKALSDYVKKKSIESGEENIFVSTGSQSILDNIGKIFISKGDKVAVEAPTYLGALQAFNPYEPEYVKLETDDSGLLPESLEKVLSSHNIKFIYLVTNFQNPTGRTIPYERRKKIAEIIKKHNALLVEDDPYGELRYEGEHVKPIKTMAHDNVIYLSTLSKVFAPGLRIGFCVANKDIIYWLAQSKQGVDLHSDSYSQALAAEYLSGGYLDSHLPKILSVYKPRQQAMLNALDEFFPKNFSWSKPEGGMFVWVRCPGIDTVKLYWKAVENNVAYVPGRFFFTVEGEGLDTLRLNFTNVKEESITNAVKKLGAIFKKEN